MRGKAQGGEGGKVSRKLGSGAGAKGLSKLRRLFFPFVPNKSSECIRAYPGVDDLANSSMV